jgi:hypothetical protein
LRFEEGEREKCESLYRKPAAAASGEGKRVFCLSFSSKKPLLFRSLEVFERKKNATEGPFLFSPYLSLPPKQQQQTKLTRREQQKDTDAGREEQHQPLGGGEWLPGRAHGFFLFFPFSKFGRALFSFGGRDKKKTREREKELGFPSFCFELSGAFSAFFSPLTRRRRRECEVEEKAAAKKKLLSSRERERPRERERQRRNKKVEEKTKRLSLSKTNLKFSKTNLKFSQFQFFPLTLLLLLLLLPALPASRSRRRRRGPGPETVQLRIPVLQGMTTQHLAVRRQVLPAEVGEELPAAREHALQAPRRALVLPVVG